MVNEPIYSYMKAWNNPVDDRKYIRVAVYAPIKNVILDDAYANRIDREDSTVEPQTIHNFNLGFDVLLTAVHIDSIIDEKDSLYFTLYGVLIIISLSLSIYCVF